MFAQGLNHREIASRLNKMGHQVTPAQVYGFLSKISPDERNRILAEQQQQESTSMEQLEATAARVLVKMEGLLDEAMDEGTESFMAISSFSNQLGQWLDRLAKLKAKQPDRATVQIQVVVNNFQVLVDTMQDVLLSDDDLAEAYALIDERLKERLGPQWGRVDLTQPSAVASMAPMTGPVKQMADGDLSAGTVAPGKQKKEGGKDGNKRTGKGKKAGTRAGKGSRKPRANDG